MKSLSNRIHRCFLHCAGILLLSAPVMAQTDSTIIRCLTDEVEELKIRRNPSYKHLREKTEQSIQAYVRANRGRLRTAATDIIRIPVVVHVVHNRQDGTIGGTDNPNITDEQIRSQISVLNDDYRKKEGSNGWNQDPVGVDTGIEFELAQYDPNGRGTTGITRNYSTRATFNPYTDDQTLAGIVSWPSDRYLNVWVCSLGTAYLGVAHLPSVDGLGGLDTTQANEANTDGVIINYKYFGSREYISGLSALQGSTYDLGRTTTHEIGHWLGLLHTWGNRDNFCGTDYCDDTPQARAGNLTFDCEPRFVDCNGANTRVMIENYMDYSPDRCMNIFTADQLARVRAVLELSPRRLKLLQNLEAGRLEESERLTVNLFPNPGAGELFADVRFKDFKTFSVTIFDQRGIKHNAVTYNDVWSRRITLNTSKLMPGLYILKISTGDETVSKRFVYRNP